MKTKRPEIGTELYFVAEHRYYNKGRAAPLFEYCIIKGRLREFFEGGYIEMKIEASNPYGYQTPYFYKLSEIGKTVFYTFEEAVQHAEKLSDYHDEHIGLPLGGEPLRRPWRKAKNHR